MNDNYIRERLFELIENSDITAAKLSEELHLNKGYLLMYEEKSKAFHMMF